MLFNSLTFVLFFAVFIALWPLARRGEQRRWAYLVAASAVFYGWWDWRFLGLIALSGAIDFWVGGAIPRYPNRRRALLAVSIVANLGLLSAFKYAGFLGANLNLLLALLGVDVQLQIDTPPLPVGISFYTFQSMSYTIDIYRGRLSPTRHPLHFFAYLALFPQLVAGPIVRASQLLPQLRTAPPVGDARRWRGLRLVAHGAFKKVVIADNLAPVVDAAFAAARASTDAVSVAGAAGAAGTVASAGASGAVDGVAAMAVLPGLAGGTLYWWLIITMFAFQIYCDFSGYSDIARGLAQWMGYRFPRNFDHPYTSVSLREFWSRWHISLSTWFRDYVYVPLGGSRRGALRADVAMWITMLVSGLWHGAAWTFVAWGALHAAYLSLERRTAWPRRLAALPGGRWVALALVTAQVWLAWVFFRAPSFAVAWAVTARMLGLDALRALATGAARPVTWAWDAGLSTLTVQRTALLVLGFAIAGEAVVLLARWYGRSSWRRPTLRWEPVLIAVLIALSIFLRGPGQAFIYFQF